MEFSPLHGLGATSLRQNSDDPECPVVPGRSIHGLVVLKQGCRCSWRKAFLYPLPSMPIVLPDFYFLSSSYTFKALLTSLEPNSPSRRLSVGYRTEDDALDRRFRPIILIKLSDSLRGCLLAHAARERAYKQVRKNNSEIRTQHSPQTPSLSAVIGGLRAHRHTDVSLLRRICMCLRWRATQDRDTTRA